jgi:hypothetical protein
MSYRDCWRCRNTFYTESYSSLCSVCVQTEAIEKINRNQQQNDYLRQLAAQEAQLEFSAKMKEIGDKLKRDIKENEERREKIQKQMRVKSEEARNFGYGYIDNEFFNVKNPLNLKLYVDKSVKMQCAYDDPYLLTRLNEQFNEGIRDRLCEIKPNREIMREEAYKAGNKSANSLRVYLINHRSPDGKKAAFFHLNTGIKVNTFKIYLSDVETNFKSKTSEETGELSMTWDSPFEDEELNSEFCRGVQEICAAMNTDELKAERKKKVLAEIIWKRQQKKNEMKRKQKEWQINREKKQQSIIQEEKKKQAIIQEEKKQEKAFKREKIVKNLIGWIGAGSAIVMVWIFFG